MHVGISSGMNPVKRLAKKHLFRYLCNHKGKAFKLPCMIPFSKHRKLTRDVWSTLSEQHQAWAGIRLHLQEDAGLGVRRVVLVEVVATNSHQRNLHGLGTEAILSVVHWVYNCYIEDRCDLCRGLIHRLYANHPFHRLDIADKAVWLRRLCRIR